MAKIKTDRGAERMNAGGAGKRRPRGKKFTGNIPNELVKLILQHLPFHKLLELRFVNSTWLTLCNEVLAKHDFYMKVDASDSAVLRAPSLTQLPLSLAVPAGFRADVLAHLEAVGAAPSQVVLKDLSEHAVELLGRYDFMRRALRLVLDKTAYNNTLNAWEFEFLSARHTILRVSEFKSSTLGSLVATECEIVFDAPEQKGRVSVRLERCLLKIFSARTGNATPLTLFFHEGVATF